MLVWGARCERRGNHRRSRTLSRGSDASASVANTPGRNSFAWTSSLMSCLRLPISTGSWRSQFRLAFSSVIESNRPISAGSSQILLWLRSSERRDDERSLSSNKQGGTWEGLSLERDSSLMIGLHAATSTVLEPRHRWVDMPLLPLVVQGYSLAAPLPNSIV